jgi:CXXC-20-CXXC protein
MPFCKNCGHKWGWKYTFKAQFNFKMKLKCPNCNQVQYISTHSKKKVSFLNMGIIIVWGVLNYFGVPTPWLTGILIALFTAVFVFMPFTYELSSEDEPLW